MNNKLTQILAAVITVSVITSCSSAAGVKPETTSADSSSKTQTTVVKDTQSSETAAATTTATTAAASDSKTTQSTITVGNDTKRKLPEGFKEHRNGTFIYAIPEKYHESDGPLGKKTFVYGDITILTNYFEKIGNASDKKIRKEFYDNFINLAEIKNPGEEKIIKVNGRDGYSRDFIYETVDGSYKALGNVVLLSEGEDSAYLMLLHPEKADKSVMDEVQNILESADFTEPLVNNNYEFGQTITFRNFEVTITGIRRTAAIDGTPGISIRYEFRNTSDEKMMAVSAMKFVVTQGDKVLDNFEKLFAEPNTNSLKQAEKGELVKDIHIDFPADPSKGDLTVEISPLISLIANEKHRIILKYPGN